MKLIPAFLYYCRDILSIYDGIKFSSQKDSEQCKTYLSRFAVILEQFLFKLDDALEEVNLASEMLILYLQVSILAPSSFLFVNYCFSLSEK